MRPINLNENPSIWRRTRPVNARQTDNAAHIRSILNAGLMDDAGPAAPPLPPPRHFGFAHRTSYSSSSTTTTSGYNRYFSSSSSNNKSNSKVIELTDEDITVLDAIDRPSNLLCERDVAKHLSHEGMLEYPFEECPMNSGPFVPDVLCLIMMYAGSKREVLNLSGVCTMWRFYGNYLPHWTQLRVHGALFNPSAKNEGFFGTLVKPSRFRTRSLTRDELVEPYRKALRAQERNTLAAERRSFWENVVHAAITNFLLPSLAIALLLCINGGIAWATGRNDNGIWGDIEIAGYLCFFYGLICAPFYLIHNRLYDYQIKSQQLLRGITVVIVVSFTMLVPLGMLAGRISSAESIVYGGNTSLAEQRASGDWNTASISNVPARAYLTLDRPFSDGGRWAHFPTERSLDDSGFWTNAVKIKEEGANRTCHQFWRYTTTSNGDNQHDYYGCYFILYDRTTKPTDTNDPSVWGTATNPRSKTKLPATDKTHCYNDMFPKIHSDIDAFNRMNCLFDVAMNSPAWKGTTFVAIAGKPEDMAKRYRDGAFKAEHLTYRTVRRTANYNSEFSIAESEFWSYKQNDWWRKAGVYFLESAWPETLEEGNARVESLNEDLDKFVIAVVIVSVVLGLIPLFFDPDAFTPGTRPIHRSVMITVALAMLIINPFSVGAFGVLCIKSTMDPRTRDETWLMCQPPAGGGLLALAVGVGALFIPVYQFISGIDSRMKYLKGSGYFTGSGGKDSSNSAVKVVTASEPL